MLFVAIEDMPVAMAGRFVVSIYQRIKYALISGV
jgi:hypothetical protein